uniref:Uncharacterized protein n=1 Tax=Macaca fascicularis TaxID=9541 RepID=A0A2K5UCW2_MACFA
MDADDSRAPKGSLRKFLEHLFGARKAIGVLTSGGDAQADAWKGPDGGFPPVSGPRTEQGWSRDGPPAHGPGDLPFALGAGRVRVLQVGALWAPPARRGRLRDAGPVVSLRPGRDIRLPRTPRARSVASPGPAPPAGDPSGSARLRPAARPPAPLGSALALAF